MLPGICAHCKAVIVAGGVKQDGKKFCSERCATASAQPVGFCPNCLADTDDVSTGNMSRINGIGTTLIRVRGQTPCPNCGSAITRVWFTALYIPLIPLKKYRVVWTAGRRFLSRRLKPTAA